DGRAAIGNGKVEAHGFEIAQIGDRRQPDPDLRVLLDEIADPRLQPLGGKAGAARDEQVAPLRLWRYQSRRARDRCKSALDLAGIDAPGSRQRCAAGVPGEDPNTKEVLEVLYLVADGRWRDPELLGGAAEAAMSRGGLERQQRLERRHSRPLR